ncbi:MAG: PRC-barrel domain-containing protein [Vicinamibacterales bacterium]
MAIDEASAARETGLRSGLEVRGAKGRLLGAVENVLHEPATGEPVAFTVRHGLFGRKRKHLPIHTVQRIDGAAVVLRFTITEFKQLPDGTV